MNQNRQLIQKIIKDVNLISDVEVLNQILYILIHNHINSNSINVYPGSWGKYSRNTSRIEFINQWKSDVTSLRSKNKYIADNRSNLRICTFNVHFWKGIDNILKIDEMLEEIKLIDADVICLQESILPEGLKRSISTTKDGLRRKTLMKEFEQLGYKYYTACQTNNKNHTGYDSFFGNIILSKFELSNLDNITLYTVPNGETRCFTKGTIMYNNSPVHILSVHLDVWDDTETVRDMQMKEIIKFANKLKGNIVICGDFNALWRKDYTNNEWDWLDKNNKNVPLQNKVLPQLEQSGYKEAFGPGNIKYSAWTARRVDYVWYKGDIKTSASNVYYTSVSDHFPLVVDFVGAAIHKPAEKTLLNLINNGESVKGRFDELLFTHNTPLYTLNHMLMGDYELYIRGCMNKHQAQGRGAQFRYGIDSQYGDIMFIMKPTWNWQSLKGSEPNPYGGPAYITDYPIIGHIFKEGFMKYDQYTQKDINKTFKHEANEFDFRPDNVTGNGMECSEDDWIFSWCNYQLHLAENITFDNVEVVLAPRWLITDQNAIDSIKYDEGDGESSNKEESINNLQKAITNNFPKLSNGKTNTLNGKFVLYGPEKQDDAYAYFSRIIREFDRYYPNLTDDKYNINNGSTMRTRYPLGNSSQLAISASAYLDAEKVYMKLLMRHKMMSKKK